MKRATFVKICRLAGHDLERPCRERAGVCCNLMEAFTQAVNKPWLKSSAKYAMVDHFKAVCAPRACRDSNKMFWLEWKGPKTTYKIRQTSLLLFEQHVLTSKEYLRW